MNFIYTFVTHEDDARLGRLDPTLLSTQAQLEIAFDGVKNKSKFVDENGNYQDIGEWDGLVFDEKSGDLIGMEFALSNDDDDPADALCGTGNCAYLPQTLQVCFFNHNKINGTLQVGDMPQNIQIFQAGGNHLTGTIETAQLANSLRELILRENRFHGTFD